MGKCNEFQQLLGWVELNLNGDDCYIGFGNYNSDVLIVGKEAAIDNCTQQFKEITENLEKHKKGGFLCDYENQLCKIYCKNHPNNGTSRTWLRYQQLIKKQLGEHIDFYNYCFVTELSSVCKKRSGGKSEETKKSILNRLAMFEQPFFRNFKYVVLACGNYPQMYDIDIPKVFFSNVENVRCKHIWCKEKSNGIYDIYSDDKRTLIHTYQFASNETTKCIECIRSNNLIPNY